MKRFALPEHNLVKEDSLMPSLINLLRVSHGMTWDEKALIEALTSNALDASMNTSPSWSEFRDEVRANRPLISFVPGHSRCVAGFTSTRIFSWYLFRGLLVYDPWPPTTGVITQWENFDATTYRRTFTAHVNLV